ncbi:MAG: hypothetical protein U0271_10550 [Polyangiaceae bacterium]
MARRGITYRQEATERVDFPFQCPAACGYTGVATIEQRATAVVRTASQQYNASNQVAAQAKASAVAREIGTDILRVARCPQCGRRPSSGVVRVIVKNWFIASVFFAIAGVFLQVAFTTVLFGSLRLNSTFLQLAAGAFGLLMAIVGLIYAGSPWSHMKRADAAATFTPE